MGRTTTTKQAALARARERRLALEAARDGRDQRVDQAAAEVVLLLEQRSAAEAAAAEATLAIAARLRQLLADGLDVEGAAALVELDPLEVRRLTRKTAGPGARQPPASPL